MSVEKLTFHFQFVGEIFPVQERQDHGGCADCSGADADSVSRPQDRDQPL